MILGRHLGRDQRGAAIVELAIVAPVFVSMLIGAIDLTRGYLVKLDLEQAAQEAVEKITKENLSAQTETTVQNEIADAAGVDSRDVAIEYRLKCDGRLAVDQYDRCADDSVTARFLSVEIRKIYRPVFAARFAGANADGSYLLTGRAGVQIQ